MKVVADGIASRIGVRRRDSRQDKGSPPERTNESIVIVSSSVASIVPALGLWGATCWVEWDTALVWEIHRRQALQ
jgi:hypothetical protein